MFANRLIQRIEELQYCTITGNIDKSDMNSINIKDFDNIDYIVVATIYHFQVYDEIVVSTLQLPSFISFLL